MPMAASVTMVGGTSSAKKYFTIGMVRMRTKAAPMATMSARRHSVSGRARTVSNQSAVPSSTMVIADKSKTLKGALRHPTRRN